MCFSAQASFVASAAIAVLGFISFKKIKSFKIIPFAMTPLFFALQQLCEGIVWLTIETYHTTLFVMSMYGFLFFAGLFWPFWIPWSLRCIEVDPLRKKLFWCTSVIGVVSMIEVDPLRKKLFWCTSVIGVVSMFISCICVVYTGVTAKIMDHHISYEAIKQNDIINFFHIETIGSVVYVIATVVPFFISTVPLVWGAGILITIGFIVARTLYYCAFASVWCFFAALVSGAICFIVDKYERN